MDPKVYLFNHAQACPDVIHHLAVVLLSLNNSYQRSKSPNETPGGQGEYSRIFFPQNYYFFQKVNKFNEQVITRPFTLYWVFMRYLAQFLLQDRLLFELPQKFILLQILLYRLGNPCVGCFILLHIDQVHFTVHENTSLL